MILVVSNQEDGHGDIVCRALDELGTKYIRFSLEDYPRQLNINFSLNNAIDPCFVYEGQVIDFSSIQSVWFRRPGYPVYDARLQKNVLELVKEETEKFITGFWYLIDCYWMSKPENIYYAEHKPMQLRVAQQVGWSIPPTLITNNVEAAMRFYEEHHHDIIVKPLSRSWIDWEDNGTKKEQVFYTTPVDARRARQLKDVKYCPTFLQKRIEKAFELRITVVGNRIFACKIDSQKSPKARDDWRRYDLDNTPHSIFELPSDITRLCIELASNLGLNFGAIDVIVTPDGDFVLCEINPNGQWYWIEGLTSLPITQAVAEVLTEKTNIARTPLWATQIQV